MAYFTIEVDLFGSAFVIAFAFAIASATSYDATHTVIPGANATATATALTSKHHMKSHASMNRIYRLVFNAALGIWVAVAENAKGRGKGGRAASSLLAVLTILSPAAYAANAADATLRGGSGTVATAGAATTITQTSPRLAIDWTTLSTARNEALVFAQPNAQAIALNRITGSDPSNFLGSLSANGQVFVLNPNGVLFGAGSSVNVGGLVASTLSMSNADFMAGNNVFSKGTSNNNTGTGTGTGTGSVVNQGTLTAAIGGYIALLAPEVRNEGVVSATLGTALLAAGNKVTLNLNNGSLLGYSIDQGALHALADNRQLILADGGQVILSAKAFDALASATVNNTGVIEARTIQNKAGRILLMGDMAVGTVNVAGTLDASAPNGGDGGFVETSAAHVKVADVARVTTLAALGKTGTWLIDPTDFTVAATGGDISGATLSSNLGSGSVTLQNTNGTTGATTGNGDIFINDAVTWGAATQLTLNAQRNININQSITATNAAGSLALVYGQGAVAAGNTADYYVKAPVNLQAGNNFSTQLGSNGSVVSYKVITSLGAAGSTTGTDLQGMNGNLAGNYVLGSNIDAQATSGWNGGAGFAPVSSDTSAPFTGIFDGLGHAISNLTINRPTNNYVGLFGYASSGGVIRNVGLVGGSVSGNFRVGELVGYNDRGSVANSYATGSVSGNYRSIGGLVGSNYGSITNSYATGSVSGSGSGSGSNTYVGGLVGYNGRVLTNSYAMGSVTNSYATGSVSGDQYVGGLTGFSYGGGVTNSYWNTTTSGQTTSSGGTGLTTAQMQQRSNFTGWDFANIWTGYDGFTSPLLRSFLTPVTVTSSASKVYDGQAYTTAIAPTYASPVNTALVLGTLGYGAATNAGTYALSGLYSNQQGYFFSYAANAAVTITKANITLGTGNVTKGYDGTTSAAGTLTTSGSLYGATLSGGTFAYTDKNAGTGNKTVTTRGVTVGDGNNGNNFNVSYANNTTSTITQAALSVTAGQASKTYDGTTNTLSATTAAAAVGTLAGASAGETVSAAASQAFTDKNAGTNKTVHASGLTIKDSTNADVTANYAITYADNTTSTINKAALSVSANNASQPASAVPYSGGNGVAYSGFVNGESVAVLGGSLAYGGGAQGATTAGSYTLTANGLTADNYALTYVNGLLNLQPTNVLAFSLGSNALTDAYLSAQDSTRWLARQDAPEQRGPALTLLRCGVAMPSGFDTTSCP